MRISKKILCFGILFSFISINAQEFELGKVSVAELQEKNHPTDSSAVAAILYSKGRTYFGYSESKGFVVVTDVETRIKIYKKGGYEWANKVVEIFTGATPIEKISFSKSVTYNLVDGKIEKTKLKSDGEFSEKLNKFWSVAKITMPNVKEGSVIEYKYTVESPYVSTLTEWKFQNKIPVNYSEYITEIPQYYNYNSFFKGFLAPSIFKSSKRESIVLTSKDRGAGRVVSTTYSNDKFEFQSNVTKYILKDIPAINDEAFVNNIENYSSSILHELASTEFPNAMLKPYATDWESIVKTIYDNENFGGELTKKNYYEEDLNAVIAAITDRNTKMIAIFQFVKERMNWNNYTGYYCNDGVKTAYKQKTGNIAEINLMLASMLQSAGFEAKPVLVSTRSNGIAIFPNKSAYNYVIVAVEDNNKIVLLDATDKYSLPNQIPFRALNWFGRLIRNDGSSVTIDLMPNQISNENVMMNYSIDETGKVTGKIRRQYSEYNAQLYRNKYVGVKEEQYLEMLENDLNKIEISEYVRSNAAQIYQPVQETFSFTGNDFCDVVGDKIYVSPMIFLCSKKNPFNQEKREYPVDFGFPWQDKYSINIEIPEGYVVESIPAVAQIETAQNICNFKYNILANGTKIQLSITQEVTVPIVSPVNYPLLQESYKKILEKENEKIVLKKV
jgi:transglutaminase-like putative cysteine protease